MFRRFRNYPQIGGKRGGLPYDYEVEYIKIDGSIIDFDIPNFTPATHNIETEIEYFGDTSGQHNIIAWNNSLTNGTNLGIINGKWGYQGKVTVVPDEFATIRITGGGQYINGMSTWIYSNGNGGKYLHVGTLTSLLGKGTAQMNMKKLKVVLKSDGSLFAELIPCVKDGNAAFYDSVRERFFYASVSDYPLVAGPKI